MCVWLDCFTGCCHLVAFLVQVWSLVIVLTLSKMEGLVASFKLVLTLMQGLSGGLYLGSKAW